MSYTYHTAYSRGRGVYIHTLYRQDIDVQKNPEKIEKPKVSTREYVPADTTRVHALAQKQYVADREAAQKYIPKDPHSTTELYPPIVPIEKSGTWLKETSKTWVQIPESMKKEIANLSDMKNTAEKTKDEIYSRFVTGIYTRFTARLERSGLSNTEAINAAGDFMRMYATKYQNMIQAGTTVEALRTSRKADIESFAKSKNITLAPSLSKATASTQNPSTPTDTVVADNGQTPADAALGLNVPEKRHIEWENVPIDASVGKTADIDDEDDDMDTDAIVAAHTAYVDSEKAYTEYVAQIEEEVSKNPEKLAHTEDIHDKNGDIPPDIARSIVDPDRVDDILTDMQVWDTEKIILADEAGASQVEITKISATTYSMRQPDGSVLVISAKNQEDLEKQMLLIGEIMQTPLLRRTLSAGTIYWEKMQKMLAAKNPGRDMSVAKNYIPIALDEMLQLALPDERVRTVRDLIGIAGQNIDAVQRSMYPYRSALREVFKSTQRNGHALMNESGKLDMIQILDGISRGKVA